MVKLSIIKKVNKGWGHEIHIINCKEYCMKKLVFTKKHAKFSMHFHRDKKETWYVEEGEFKVIYINTQNAEKVEKTLSVGEVWTNEQFFPHQLICLTDNAVITEVSTYDRKEDNYRVEAGDSQKKK